MAADVDATLTQWSTTAASNKPAGSTSISNNLDDNLREIQKVVRQQWASTSIASAATTNLASVNERFVTVTGTTTITALGTLSAGIERVLVFAGVLTLTHNGTSLILPGGGNITTAAGDVATMLSLGSGNWRCIDYQRASGAPLATGTLDAIGDAVASGTVAAANYDQSWTWQLTTAARTAMKFTESAASSSGAGSQFLCEIGTLATSTASPLRVSARGNEVLRVHEDGEFEVTVTGSGDGGDFTVNAARSINATTTSTTAASIQFNTGSGGSVRMNDGTDVFRNRLRIPEYQKLVFYADGAAPTITAGGGTGASITGQDQAFTVTIGTGSPTTVTVTFAQAFATTPVAVATSSQSGLILHVTPGTTTVQIQSSAAMSSGTKIHCIVMGVES